MKTDTEQFMQDISGVIDTLCREAFKEPMGFVLVMMPFSGGIGNYLSNCNRDDVILALREMADRLEAKQDLPPAEGTA